VEQQRLLGRTAPSLYDLRNLFQVNVEEGRHLWAMVYLLQAYFGRDGRDEADMILERHAGDPDRPRILGAFNELTPDWLAFYMFTYFTDRDGKYQLASLAESAFDPLARTCRFMLTEEAHHMFVGESGVKRVVQRTAELMRDQDTVDVRPFGGIDLGTIQRYINFHYSVSLDLFGGERSTNAAAYYNAGLKGRYNETKINDDHLLSETFQLVPEWRDGAPTMADVPAINALNECLRQDFVRDCARGLARWNTVLEEHAIITRLSLPHIAFNRRIGNFADYHVTPEGVPLDEEQWAEQCHEWLPSDKDKAFVSSLMQPVTKRGKIAGWIAPPPRGIDGLPFDYEYVRLF
jgi:benzoyl-CoA 2,3-dioxygenase component B